MATRRRPRAKIVQAQLILGERNGKVLGRRVLFSFIIHKAIGEIPKERDTIMVKGLDCERSLEEVELLAPARRHTITVRVQSQKPDQSQVTNE